MLYVALPADILALQDWPGRRANLTTTPLSTDSSVGFLQASVVHERGEEKGKKEE